MAILTGLSKSEKDKISVTSSRAIFPTFGHVIICSLIEFGKQRQLLLRW